MKLGLCKVLGSLGAIFLGAFVPILNIIGAAFFFVALKNLAEHYAEPHIFKNALYGFSFNVLSAIAASLIFLIVFFPQVFSGLNEWFIPILAILSVFSTLQAMFHNKSFTMLTKQTGEKSFKIAGALLIIGSILTIVIIGVVIQLVAWVLVTAAFFTLKPLV